MRSSQGSQTAYNLQTAVDTDTHLIVHHEMVQDGDDSRQLRPMAEAVQAGTGDRLDLATVPESPLLCHPLGVYRLYAQATLYGGALANRHPPSV